MLHEKGSPFKAVGPYLPTFLILGIAIPSVLFLTIMVMIGWATPVIGARGFLSFDSSSASVYLYEAEGTHAHFAKVGGNYETLLTPWRDYFTERKRSFKQLKTPSEIAKLKTGVIILPSALALSSMEKNAVLAFRDRGGSVLATWATGTRDEKGAWAGWDFL